MSNQFNMRLATAGRADADTVSADELARMRYDAHRKSIFVAYLLWFFFGGLGGHRFYMARTQSALTLLISAIVIHGLGLAVSPLFYMLALVPFVWVLVDAFLIPGMVRQHNDDLVSKLA